MIIYTTLAVEPDSGNGNRDNERISAEELYERLIERQYKRIALFTGQITNGDERHQIVEDWAAERIDIVVATSAFGMGVDKRSEEHMSELQSLMRISYAVICLKKKKQETNK